MSCRCEIARFGLVVCNMSTNTLQLTAFSNDLCKTGLWYTYVDNKIKKRDTYESPTNNSRLLQTCFQQTAVRSILNEAVCCLIAVVCYFRPAVWIHESVHWGRSSLAFGGEGLFLPGTGVAWSELHLDGVVSWGKYFLMYCPWSAGFILQWCECWCAM